MSGWASSDDAKKGVKGKSGRTKESAEALPRTPAAADADNRAHASMRGDGGVEGGGMALTRPRWGAPFVTEAN